MAAKGEPAKDEVEEEDDMAISVIVPPPEPYMMFAIKTSHKDSEPVSFPENLHDPIPDTGVPRDAARDRRRDETLRFAAQVAGIPLEGLSSGQLYFKLHEMLLPVAQICVATREKEERLKKERVIMRDGTADQKKEHTEKVEAGDMQLLRQYQREQKLTDEALNDLLNAWTNQADLASAEKTEGGYVKPFHSMIDAGVPKAIVCRLAAQNPRQGATAASQAWYEMLIEMHTHAPRAEAAATAAPAAAGSAPAAENKVV